MPTISNIFEDKITASNIKLIWESLEQKPYVFQMMFPNTRQLGLRLDYIKGKDNLPVALVSSNFDADVLYRDIIGFDTLSFKLPFFKEATKTDEELRQAILTTDPRFRDQLWSRLFKQSTDLLLGAEATAERLRASLIANGSIAIKENNVNKEYDFGFDKTTQLVTETTLWSVGTAKPFNSFNARIKAYKKLTGKTAKYAVMNSTVFDYLANDAEIIKYFQSLSTPILYPNEDNVKSYIASTTGVTIIIADAQYIAPRDNTYTAVDFYPQDRYTLLSTLDLGETVYGTTPEEADLLSGGSQASSVEITGNGVAITTWKQPDPVWVNTKVSEVVCPSCPNIDKIYIVKVLGA